MSETKIDVMGPRDYLVVNNGSDMAAGVEGETAQRAGPRSRGDGGGAAVPAARKVAHLTPGERMARGKAARNEVPRSSHGRWEPAVNRPDPVALLEEQGGGKSLHLHIETAAADLVKRAVSAVAAHK